MSLSPDIMLRKEPKPETLEALLGTEMRSFLSFRLSGFRGLGLRFQGLGFRAKGFRVKGRGFRGLG